MTACWEAEKEGMDELDQYEELEEDDQAMMVIIKDVSARHHRFASRHVRPSKELAQ